MYKHLEGSYRCSITITKEVGKPNYTGVQVGTNVHVSHLTYTDAIMILSTGSSETQGLLEAVNRHVAAVGMRISA